MATVEREARVAVADGRDARGHGDSSHAHLRFHVPMARVKRQCHAHGNCGIAIGMARDARETEEIHMPWTLEIGPEACC